MYIFSRRLLLTSALLCSFLFGTDVPSSLAGDERTHLYATYMIALELGFTPTQAARIAGANQSLDDNSDTTAWEWPPSLQWMMKGEAYHSLAPDVLAADLGVGEGTYQVINRLSTMRDDLQ